MIAELSNIADKLPLTVASRLSKVSVPFVTEIHIKAGFPLLVMSDKTLHVCSGASLSVKEVSEAFMTLCDYSAYAKKSQLSDGFTTVSGGHRVFVCATATENGLRDISSIVVRIARDIKGCAAPIFSNLENACELNLLICGEVGCGKTTILRDFVRIAASEPRNRRVAVVDERAEIAAMNRGISAFDIGHTSEVLSLYPREKGFEMAIRGLSPDIIVCDELFSADDIARCENAKRCGIKVVASAHAATGAGFESSIFGRSVSAAKIFDYLIFLNPLSSKTRIREIVRTHSV